MQNGYYVTTGAMVTQFNRLDVISNNLANVNTAGFKRDDVVVGDFKRVFQEQQEQLPIKNHTYESAKYLNSSINSVPQVSEEYINFHQGSVKQTGNPLDFSLKRDNAFFMVKTPSGFALTKDGGFQVNSDGVLSTKDGYPIVPSNYFKDKKFITIDSSSTFSVDKSGNIFTKDLNNGLATPEEASGSLFIAQSKDLKSLQKDGSNLYRIKNINDVTGLQKADVVAQGSLEMSNINPVKEMIGLIDAQRMVEMYQKVMTSHMNDVNNDAINKLATTRA